MKKYLPIIVFTHLLGMVGCLAQPSRLVYTNPKQLVEMGISARYFEDTSNQLSYREILQISDSRFVDGKDKIINLGFSPSRIWLKFTIENRTAEPLFAILEAQDVDFVDAYVSGKDTTYFMETGSLKPFGNRAFSLNSIVLPLGKQPRQVLISLKDMNGLVFPIKLAAIHPLMDKIYHETMINAFVVGVMMLAILYSFFMYFSLRDRTYLFYGLHVIFSLFTLLIFEGYLFELFWRDMPFMNNGINSSFVRLMTLLTSIVFSVAFLNLGQTLSSVTGFYKVISLVAILTVLAKIMGVQNAEVWFNMTVLITFLSFLAVGFILYRKGFRPARFYLLGWGVYIVEMVLLMLTLFNILSFDHFYTYFGYQIGSMFQAVFMTFALTDRIDMLRNEATDANSIAVKYMEENKQILEQQNRLMKRELNISEITGNQELEYLLKSIRSERERTSRISISTQEGLIFCDIKNIVRIEAQGSYTYIWLDDRQKILASRTLSTFEKQLEDFPGFVKVHKSHLANLDYVSRYQKGDGGCLILKDGTELAVSRAAKAALLQKLGLDMQ